MTEIFDVTETDQSMLVPEDYAYGVDYDIEMTSTTPNIINR